ncbi:MAG: 4Fe-4S binding protein [Pseudomonadota bacterium]
MLGLLRSFFALIWLFLTASLTFAEPTDRDTLAALIVPPMSLGEKISDDGVYELLNSGGAHAGYVFETEPMAPLPGFSGAPINVLVVLDLDGRFLDVQLLTHNEPIFVSGLPEKLFFDFFKQYRGHSISDTLVVGSPYGEGSDGSALVYLDGVTKGTASVRIAHESILAAALQIAREKMGGVSAGPPAYPDLKYNEKLTWDDIVAQGLAVRKRVTNAEVQALFQGTLWEDDDPEAADDPEGVYLDLWLVDLGPPSIARAVLSEDSFASLQEFMSISTSDEPLLVVEAGRHGLVSESFVRNTSPNWLSAAQGGFPIALRDADLIIELSDEVPEELHDAVDFGAGLILRTDRRLGFDPASAWTFSVDAVREHGMFQPEIGSVTIDIDHQTDARFFDRPTVQKPNPPWLEALRGRAADMIIAGLAVTLLCVLLFWGQSRLASLTQFTPVRLSILAVTTCFVGWWGQGQLSIVTPLATLRTALEGGSFVFLIYDSFSLVIWAFAIAGLVLWGRGLFCGWLCPFGALQEFASHLGRLLKIRQITLPKVWEERLSWLKYGVLAALVGVVFLAPEYTDKAAEVEPFKTAITTFFVREWYYVLYAVFWLVLSMMLFKGFCRFVCPLGALMAIGGALRTRSWIPRRTDCGSPCQLCKVKCRYGAIQKSGVVTYSECFQCLDCVTIHNDAKQCVPLILAARGKKKKPRPRQFAVPAE